jgi:hypothetical protein
MAYVTTVVEKRPEILTQCQLVTDSDSDQPLAQLHALALHDDDQLALAAFKFALTGALSATTQFSEKNTSKKIVVFFAN